MNSTAKLAKEKFGGDLIRTMHYMLTTFDEDTFEEYCKDFTPRQASAYFDVIHYLSLTIMTVEEQKEELGDNYEDYKTHMELFSDPQKRNTPNPHAGKTRNGIILLAAGLIISLAALLLFSDGLSGTGIFSAVGYAVTLLGLTNIVSQSIKYHHYEKMKTIYEISYPEKH